MEKTNSSVPAVYCAAPFEFQGRRIRDLAPRDFNCITAGFLSDLCSLIFVPAERRCLIRFVLSADFAVYQTFPFHSVSAESYEFDGDQFVTFAQPDSGFCAVYVWDHVELVFRRFHNITCRSAAERFRFGVLCSHFLWLFSSAFSRVLQTGGHQRRPPHDRGSAVWWLSHLQVGV